MDYDPKHPKKIIGLFLVYDQEIAGVYEDTWHGGWQITVPPENLIQASGNGPKNRKNVKLIKEYNTPIDVRGMSVIPVGDQGDCLTLSGKWIKADLTGKT